MNDEIREEQRIGQHIWVQNTMRYGLHTWGLGILYGVLYKAQTSMMGWVMHNGSF